MFSDPNLFKKLGDNPRTAKHLADPAFVQQLQFLQKNPNLAQGALQDPRMIDVMGALMGIDMQGFEREMGSEELPPGYKKADEPSSPPPPPAASSSSSAPKSPPPPAQKEEDVEMAEPEDDETAKAKAEAEAEKKLGADAYKARKLDEAITHFQKAWDIYPQDMTFLTNLAGEFRAHVGDLS